MAAEEKKQKTKQKKKKKKFGKPKGDPVGTGCPNQANQKSLIYIQLALYFITFYCNFL